MKPEIHAIVNTGHEIQCKESSLFSDVVNF